MSLFFAVCSRATAQEAPVIVNPQTGAAVNLTRAYWDANVDIANKKMQCDYFSFNAETGVFEKGRDRFTAPISRRSELFLFNTEYSHPPLSNVTTRPVNFARVEVVSSVLGPINLDRHLDIPFWAVDDGVYLGPAPLTTSEFVEIVAFNASTDNAVRVWFEDASVPSYSVCYDLDGTTLLPTGTVGSGNTQLVDLPDFTFDFPEPYESIPEITNLETGEPVQIARGRWTYNKDIAGSIIDCDRWNFRDQDQTYSREADSGFTTAYHTYNGGESIYFSSRSDIDQSLFSIRNQNVSSTVSLPSLFDDDFMEITEDGYRMWLGSGGTYHDCRADFSLVEFGPAGLDENIPFAPTEFLPLLADEASPTIDSDDSLVLTDNCDYTDADDFDGWGFDPITMTSCPPLDNTSSADEMTTPESTVESTDTNEGSEVVQTNPTPADDSAGDTSGSSDDVDIATENESIDVENTGANEGSDVAQTNPTTPADSSADTTSGNSDDLDIAAENETNDVEIANIQDDSTNTDLSTSESTSQSGGGSFWLPLLIFALALKRPMYALQKHN